MCFLLMTLLPSRNYVLIYMYLYICILYKNSVIERIYTYTTSVVQYRWSCFPSQSIELFWGVRGSCVECHFFLWFTNCVLFYDKQVNTRMLVTLIFVLNNILTLDIWRSAISHNPGCFCPWTFLQNIGFNVAPSVSGFATDCPCGVWCRGLTTCLLCACPYFGNRLLSNSWAVGLT